LAKISNNSVSVSNEQKALGYLLPRIIWLFTK
jgi:hypothetical protein